MLMTTQSDKGCQRAGRPDATEMHQEQANTHDVSESERTFMVAGVALGITQRPGWKGTTGGIVWDCAILLAHLLLEGNHSSCEAGYLGSLQGRRVIDLGCGTGMLGIACALIGHALVTLNRCEGTADDCTVCIPIRLLLWF